MFVYHRTPYYYETDQMRIIHHANYIRWFEEARIAYLEQMGYYFAEQEAQGIVCPVLHVEADYQKMVHFGEAVGIETRLTSYTGVRYSFSYLVKNAAQEVCCKGSSTHCFLNADGRILRPERAYPPAHAVLLQALAEE